MPSTTKYLWLHKKARSYELPSISGAESVGVIRFLMELDEPSPEIIAAVQGAISWFNSDP